MAKVSRWIHDKSSGFIHVEESEMVRLILEFLCQKYTTEPDLFML